MRSTRSQQQVVGLEAHVAEVVGLEPRQGPGHRRPRRTRRRTPGWAAACSTSPRRRSTPRPPPAPRSRSSPIEPLPVALEQVAALGLGQVLGERPPQLGLDRSHVVEPPADLLLAQQPDAAQHQAAHRVGVLLGVVERQRAAPRAAEHVPASRCRAPGAAARCRRPGGRWCCRAARRAAASDRSRAGRTARRGSAPGRRSAGRSPSSPPRDRRGRTGWECRRGCRTAPSRGCGARPPRGARGERLDGRVEVLVGHAGDGIIPGRGSPACPWGRIRNDEKRVCGPHPGGRADRTPGHGEHGRRAPRPPGAGRGSAQHPLHHVRRPRRPRDRRLRRTAGPARPDPQHRPPGPGGHAVRRTPSAPTRSARPAAPRS